MSQTERSNAAGNETESTWADRELEITRVFDAPRGLVFKAWTDPERIPPWMGPKGFTMTLFESDPRPGGAWRSRMRSPEGKELSLHGVAREISPPERFVFTQSWGNEPGQTVITIVLSEREGRTTMRFHQGVFETVESRDSSEQGWNQSFDRLEAYLATQRKR